ncbi:hypothetical protein Ahy_Scaffold1g107374 isoform F [Arachis hypogaea]|uniref:Uncharacterized protein n=1 Tax=Arachis hypogaea TaxID=3818 RepID=A0A444WVF8_ARAHY|nr:hypothetical protein Ahy_Scaffold1g107374 isoform F [Arachis hypogaea]
MVGIFSRFSVGRNIHRRTQSALFVYRVAYYSAQLIPFSKAIFNTKSFPHTTQQNQRRHPSFSSFSSSSSSSSSLSLSPSPRSTYSTSFSESDTSSVLKGHFYLFQGQVVEGGLTL